MHKKILREIKSYRVHHKILFTLLGTTGVVLIWRGLWMLFDLTPVINHPIISLILGFALVILSGFLFRI